MSDGAKGRRRKAEREANLTYMRKVRLLCVCVRACVWCTCAYVCGPVSRKRSKWGGIENEEEAQGRGGITAAAEVSGKTEKRCHMGAGPGWDFLFVSFSRD